MKAVAVRWAADIEGSFAQTVTATFLQPKLSRDLGAPRAKIEPMRILAIDYGTQRIGIALSDPTRTLARPLPFLPAKGAVKLARELATLAQKEGASLFLLGLPRNMDGSHGVAALAVKAFAETLRQTTAIPLQFVDERLSTVQASRQLHEAGRNSRRQRDRIDSEAAAVLLQAYLDSTTPGPLLES